MNKKSIFFLTVFFILIVFKSNCYSQSDTLVHPDDVNVVKVLDQMPQFPGGEESMLAYVAKNVKYPKKAKRDKVVGKVLVRFIVTETGNISDVSIVKGVREDLDAEAMRVVSTMPTWTPGIKNHKPVPVNFILPINFSLHERW